MTSRAFTNGTKRGLYIATAYEARRPGYFRKLPGTWTQPHRSLAIVADTERPPREISGNGSRFHNARQCADMGGCR